MNSNSDRPAGQVRKKHTSPEQTLPAVAVLSAGKPTILRYVDLDGNEQSLDYRELTGKDPYPIPMPVDREGYGTVETSAQFWATGYGDWLNVQEAIRRYCQNEKPNRLFDFGCATARFLRHVMSFSDLEPWGCDFAPANIDWLRKHLPQKLQLIQNNSAPELPLPDNHFDIVTAFSVFTHIDKGADQWLAELSRITKPDGILYLTIQNQAAWEKVNDRPGSLEHLKKANGISGNIEVHEDLFHSPMPENRIVFRMSSDDIYNCNVWFNNEYVHSCWSDYFEILAIADSAHTGFQSPVILRPR